MSSAEFTVARNAAINDTVTSGNYQYFANFCAEFEISIPIACPRERLMMVILCFMTLNKDVPTAKEDSVKLALELLARGFKIIEDGRALINLKEDNRRVDVPAALGLFPEMKAESNGSGTGEAIRGGTGLDIPGVDPVGSFPGDQRGILPSRQ